MWKNWKRQAWDNGREKPDYDRYRLSVREVLLGLLKSALFTGAAAYMFYRSWLGMLAWPAVGFFCLKKEKQDRRERRKERLSAQFKDAILAVCAGIQAGYSIENAFLETEGEICTLYGRDSEMAKELAAIRKGLKNRIPLEQMLLDLGVRSHVEEISDFAECFAAAKRLGGNLKEIIVRTVELTGQRMEVEREIRTMLASRRYEQKVMNLIPFFLFGYMQLTSKGFFDILYYNPAGIFIMTACLAVYLAAMFLSGRIMDIRI